MSTQDQPANPPPATDPAPTPAQPVVPQPVQPPAQPQPAPSHGSGNSPGQQLLDAINALPERIVHSLREQQPTPTPTKATPAKTEKPATTTETAPSGTTPNEPGSAPKGMTRLAHWWFNG